VLCAAGQNSVNVRASRVVDSIPRSSSIPARDNCFDADFGAGHWEFTSIQLQITIVAAPENTFFPRGGW